MTDDLEHPMIMEYPDGIDVFAVDERTDGDGFRSIRVHIPRDLDTMPYTHHAGQWRFKPEDAEMDAMVDRAEVAALQQAEELDEMREATGFRNADDQDDYSGALSRVPAE